VELKLIFMLHLACFVVCPNRTRVELKQYKIPFVLLGDEGPNRTRVELKPRFCDTDVLFGRALIEPEWN